MEPFFERDGQLCVEECPLPALAEATPTPFYVYSRRAVVERIQAAGRAFAAVPHLVCFALKANSQPALLRVLAGEGAGAEVVSGAELLLALRAGFPPERVVFSGVGKNEAELRAAVEAGIWIVNAESEGELELLNRLAGEAGRRVRVGLRVNPGIDPRTHRHMATGAREAKFGVDLVAAETIYGRRRELAHLDFRGLHAHAGSMLTLEAIAESAQRLADFAGRLAAIGVHLTELDIGGGLNIAYDGGRAPDFEDYARAVVPRVRPVGARILMELGRSLVGPAGALVLRVLYLKQVHGRRFIVVDGGMNDLLRPALYDAYHRIVPLVRREAPRELFDVVGAVCESSDAFGRDRELPRPEPGDLLAVLDTGAYGYSMSSNYNLRPRPAELLVDGDSFQVVRPGETMQELVARELGERR
jgi:diaminopimelate decarboxylase